MSPRQLQRMADGRLRARRERQQRAVVRVTAFRRWSKAGADARCVPEIPSAGDYVLVREWEATR